MNSLLSGIGAPLLGETYSWWSTVSNAVNRAEPYVKIAGTVVAVGSFLKQYHAIVTGPGTIDEKRRMLIELVTNTARGQGGAPVAYQPTGPTTSSPTSTVQPAAPTTPGGYPPNPPGVFGPQEYPGYDPTNPRNLFQRAFGPRGGAVNFARDTLVPDSPAPSEGGGPFNVKALFQYPRVN